MAGSGFVSGGAKSEPSNVGQAYGAVAFSGTGDASRERVFDLGDEADGVVIRAHPNNGGIAYLGFDDGVGTDDGFPLEAGDSFAVDLDIAENNIWAVTDTDGDELRFMVVS